MSDVKYIPNILTTKSYKMNIDMNADKYKIRKCLAFLLILQIFIIKESQFLSFNTIVQNFFFFLFYIVNFSTYIGKR